MPQSLELGGIIQTQTNQNNDSSDEEDLESNPFPFQGRKCLKCTNFKPLRAHHCSICDKCVLRMDHHCRKRVILFFFLKNSLQLYLLRCQMK